MKPNGHRFFLLGIFLITDLTFLLGIGVCIDFQFSRDHSWLKITWSGYSFAPFWCLCQKLSLSPLYLTLLHKSSERSSLTSGPGLNSSPLEAKNPTSHRSATTFHLGGSSGILQDKMGANNSSLTPLNCILKNWDRFDPQGSKKKHLVFLCDTAWPRYPLEDGERWPVGGSLKNNTVLQLDQFRKKQGKWVEVAYVLPFCSLCEICQMYVLRV